MKHTATAQPAAKKNSDGFALLYTLLIATVVLAVSSSIIGVINKEVALSGFSRNSQLAYYAADSGAECALFNLLNSVPFDGTSPASDIQCSGQTISKVAKDTPFTVSFSPSTSCAKVVVYDVPGATIIESRGYNICTPTLDRVERGVRVTVLTSE